MTVSVEDAIWRIDRDGAVERDRNDQSEKHIAFAREVIGRQIPELEALYRERVHAIGDFLAIKPVWNDRIGWRTPEPFFELKPANAWPLFDDGCGNAFALDLIAGERGPAVYFFDHETGDETPTYAAGSSLGRFLLLLAQQDQAYREGRPDGWELAIDPDIANCPRAPAIWLAE